MDNGVKKLNTITVIVSILFPVIFMLASISRILAVGKSMLGIILILVYLLLTTIGYWGSLIQGIRGVSSGQVGAIRSSTFFQLVMYIPHFLMALSIDYTIRRSSDTSERRSMMIFTILILVMIILAFVKMQMAVGDSKSTVAQGSSETARKILLICIGVPVALIVVVVLGMKLVATYPIIEKVVLIIVTLLFFGVVGLLILRILVGFANVFNLGEGGDSSSNEGTQRPTSAPSRRGNTKNNKDNIVKDLNDRYAEKFENITGRSPDALDWKIMKSGPEQEAVKNLRKRMQEEAKRNGVKGKTKYF